MHKETPQNLDATVDRIREKHTQQFLYSYKNCPISKMPIGSPNFLPPEKQQEVKIGNIIKLTTCQLMFVNDFDLNPITGEKEYVLLSYVSQYTTPAIANEVIVPYEDIETSKRGLYVILLWTLYRFPYKLVAQLPVKGKISNSTLDVLAEICKTKCAKNKLDKSILMQVGKSMENPTPEILSYMGEIQQRMLTIRDMLNANQERRNLFEVFNSLLVDKGYSFDDIVHVFIEDNKITTKDFIKLTKRIQVTISEIYLLKDIQLISKHDWMLTNSFTGFKHTQKTHYVPEKSWTFHKLSKHGKFCKKGTTITIIQNDNNSQTQKENNKNENTI